MFKRLISRGSTSKEDDEKTVNEADKEHLDEKTENASQGYDTNIEEEEEDSPYEVVRANVSPKDDVDACVLTFRVWSIGTTFSMLLSFINQFFFFRQTPIRIGFPVIMLITFLAGKLMEKMIPAKTIRPFGMERYSFSLNPGPFSVKEHGLLCVFVGTGSAIAYAIDVMVLQELYYNIKISYIEVIMFLISTQLLGYGLSGLLYNVLVKPAVMIWPDNLVSCSVLRALHGSNENDTRNGKKLMSKYNFFSLVLIGTFLYQLLPGFFFQLLASISILCFLYPNSIKAQQLGSGMTGLGLGSFTFDWTVIASYLGSPLATPYWAAVNIFVGFVFFCWIVAPLGYSMNIFDAKKFPIYGAALFDINGGKYNKTMVTLPNSSGLNEAAYNAYSPLRITYFFAINYGVALAIIPAAIVHVLIHNWSELQRAISTHNGLGKEDIHEKLMKRYKNVPWSWYVVLFLITALLGMIACEKKAIGLPWWGMLLAVAIAAILMFPFGVVLAITNVSLGVNVISEFVAGVIFAGKPIPNIVFKTYSCTAINQALWLVGDYKLGHYLKIPPRAMFIVQITGSTITGVVNLITTRFLMSNIKNFCQKTAFPWTCPNTNVFYSASVIWGLIGPIKMFGSQSIYNPLLWGFVVGGLLPFITWILTRVTKNTFYVDKIHIPIFLGACAVMPPAAAVEFPTWFIVATIFNYYIYKKFHWWWLRYNYILSAALMAGSAIAGIFIFFAFQMHGVKLQWWGNKKDFYCPLATMPSQQMATQ